MNTDNPANLVLEYTLDILEHHTFEEIGHRLPLEYLQTLPHHDKIDALRACLIVYQLMTVFNREPHSGSGGSEFPVPFRTRKDQRYFSNDRNHFWKVLAPFRTRNCRKHFNHLTISYVRLNLSLPFCYSTYYHTL